MRSLLKDAAFASWLARFLPGLGEGEPAVLFVPAQVSDRSDGKLAHLDGLNLSRAWAMRYSCHICGERHQGAFTQLGKRAFVGCDGSCPR